MTASFARAHARQYLASGFLRKIQVDNSEVRAPSRLSIYGLDKFYCLLAVRDHNKLTFNAIFLKRPANQSGIRGTILGEKDAHGSLAGRRPAGLRHAGL